MARRYSLDEPSVRRWLGDIMPVWTLLDDESYFALHHPPSRDATVTHLATDFNCQELNASPVARNAALLLIAGSISPGLKLTATGNLSRKVVAEMWESFTWPDFDKVETLSLSKVINEPDFTPLFFVRHVVQSAGLMKKYKDHLRTTKIGREVLQNEWKGALQALLFDAAFWIIDRSYLSRIDLGGWPQHEAGIVLWSLSYVADEWATPQRLVRQCCIPFASIGGGQIDREAHVFEALYLKPLYHFGMLERQSEKTENSNFLTTYFYRKSPLFDRLLSFRVKLDTAGRTHH
jgi:hypothetical protein